MRLPAFLAFTILLVLMTASGHAAAVDDPVHIVSNITYDIRPDLGPVQVTWDVTFEDRDPATKKVGSNPRFYDSVTLPVLNGASSLSGTSADGDSLDATIPEGSENAVIGAVVHFADRVFFRDSYHFTLSYQLRDVRQRSLLVTTNYVYLPIIAGGDEATVTVNTPTDAAWPASLEPGDDCVQAGNTFTCSGSPSSYLAAVAEVSRPDAMTTSSFTAQLKQASLSVNVTFFQGEDAFAAHVQELAAAALPIIEDQYGFAYTGTTNLNIAQGGRQAVLGYEGLTRCDASACDVSVSPVADDITLIHELAHLWSGIYQERWLSEGFAQLIAEETAAVLPEGLVHGHSPDRPASAVTLALDDWGDVTTVIGATDEELAIESAGYDRSLRFLQQLRFEAASNVLRDVNAAIAGSIAAGGPPANSRSYMDVAEDTTGRNLDSLFSQWIFPPSYAGVLALRREARDRLDDLRAAITAAGLTSEVPDSIRDDIVAWRFSDAMAALDDAEAGLRTYQELLHQLDQLASDASDAGLTMPVIAQDDLQAWRFSEARLAVERARLALNEYIRAGDKLNEPRNILQRFGLLGKHPEKTLEQAGAAFGDGDFERSRQLSSDAADAVSGASGVAMRRIAIVFGVAGLFAVVVLAAVWLQHRRERRFA